MVLALAARSNPAVFDRLIKLVHTEPDRTRRAEIVNAVAGAADPREQEAAFSLLLDPSVDIRDTQFMLFGAGHEASRITARKFFMAHADEILKRIPSDGATGGNTWLTFVFTSSCSPEHRDEIADYVTKTFGQRQGGERIVRQGIERMDQCIARRKLMEPELRSWLGGTGGARASSAARAAK
jgi:hypothetical protein